MRDYETLLAKDTDMPIKYKSTGVGTSILANRISWFYDFKGPSMALDTACSSSLMALHLACQSIRSGESTMVRYCTTPFPRDEVTLIVTFPRRLWRDAT